MSAQLDYGQLLKPLFAVVYLESKILSRDVSVCIFHDLSISSLFVGFQPTNTDKNRQNPTTACNLHEEFEQRFSNTTYKHRLIKPKEY